MVETVTISKKDYENLLKSNQKTIDELNKFKTEFDAYKKQSEQEIRLLKMEKEFLEEKLRLRRAEQYGRKSEQKEYVQMSIFDEVEGMNEIAAVDDKLEEVAEEIATVKNTPHKKRPKRQNFINEIDESLFEKEIKHITINKPGFRDINSDEVTKTLKVIPCKYIILEKHIHVYETVVDGERTLIRATDPEPNPLGKESVNVDFLVDVIHQKFVNAVPLYRQEKELNRSGIPISRMYMSTLITKQVSHLENLFEELKNYVKSAEIARSDETPLKVIKGITKNDVKSKNSYIWAISTGKGYKNATYYMVSNRSSSTIQEFFDGKNVKLMCDGYNAYYCSPNITPVSCMVHIRRNFAKLNKIDKAHQAKGCYTVNILDAFAKIFNMEKEITSKFSDFKVIKKERNEKLKPLYDELFKIIDDAALRALPKSALGKALIYAQNYKSTAYNVFLDGRLEIDNNESERKIKDIVIGRKNWLFCFSESGAETTCKLYSLIMTALQNNINPKKYLHLLISKFGISDLEKNDAKDYLPWSNIIQNECALKK